MLCLLSTACFQEDQARRYEIPAELEEAGQVSILSYRQNTPGDAECPYGAIVLAYGEDSNGNAILDDDEISATETICLDTPDLEEQISEERDSEVGIEEEPEEEQEQELEPELVVCEGDFVVNNTADLEALKLCKEILGTLRIESTQLATLQGLEHLEALKALYIADNPDLHTLDGLENLAQLELLHITNNPLLISLDGLQNLIRVISVNIIGNESLSSLTGLEQINVMMTLHIANNPALVSLTGLENLERTAILNLIQNTGLSSIAELESIESISNRLTILRNSDLPSCAAEALRDRIGEENIHSGVLIAGNNDMGTCE
jgi:hypothetical protein